MRNTFLLKLLVAFAISGLCPMITSADDEKIEELEARIQELENALNQQQDQEDRAEQGRHRGEGSRHGSRQGDDSLEKLLEEARRLSTEKREDESMVNRVFRGQERQQSQLNPEISLTGDFFGSYTTSDAKSIREPGDFSDGMNQFYLREAEFHIMAPLDPFTRGKFFLGIPGNGDESLSEMISEAYMEWLNLPGGMNLKIGKFNTEFGILNRWHDHGLPQVDRPRAVNNLFLGESLSGMGVGANFLLHGLWAHANEFDVQVITGGDGHSYDDAYDNVIGVAHLKNYYDITRNTYFEFGLSGAYGYNDKDRRDATSLAGADVTWKWVPSGRSHYRTTEIRGEFVMSRRETATGDLDRIGFYTYLRNKMGARFWAGLRYSYSELPVSPRDDSEWDISPVIDFWQSEFVMLRLQYSHTERNYDDNDNAVFLQTVWSMGPHKHEAY